MATKEKATIGGVLCHPKDAPPCGILAAADVLHLDLAKKEDEKLKKTIEFRFDARYGAFAAAPATFTSLDMLTTSIEHDQGGNG
jgi:hypothetical protein